MFKPKQINVKNEKEPTNYNVKVVELEDIDKSDFEIIDSSDE